MWTLGPLVGVGDRLLSVAACVWGVENEKSVENWLNRQAGI